MTTRAELLELCQAAGLRATGWKKERMERELRALESNPAAGEKPTEASPAAGDDDDPAPGAQLSGWCSGAPAWGRAHLACRDRQGRGLLPHPCGCGCHEPGWERPPVPEGATPSKYNAADRAALGLDFEPEPTRRRGVGQEAV